MNDRTPTQPVTLGDLHRITGHEHDLSVAFRCSLCGESEGMWLRQCYFHKRAPLFRVEPCVEDNTWFTLQPLDSEDGDEFFCKKCIKVCN
jgi:hypothetical protein